MNYSIFCMSIYMYLYWYRDELYIYTQIWRYFTHISMCIYICIQICIYNIHKHLFFVTSEIIICHCRDLCQSRTEKSITAVFSTPRKILNFFWQIFKFSVNLILSLTPAEIWQTSFCFISLSILQVSTIPLWLCCFNLLFSRNSHETTLCL